MKHPTIACLLGTAALLCLASSVQAQTVYRIVGADGKVTFSDKPPVNAEQGKVATTGVPSISVVHFAYMLSTSAYFHSVPSPALVAASNQ